MADTSRNKHITLSMCFSHFVDGALSGLVGGIVLQPL